MTAHPPNAAGTAGIGTPHHLACPVTAADPARYGTDMSTNTANTTSPQSNRISDMNDPLDDLCNQFSDQLDDLIMSTLRNQLPARCVADALVRAIAAISIGARINTADLMSDLADIVAETDIEYDDQQGYLH